MSTSTTTTVEKSIPTATRSRQVGVVSANIDTLWDAVKGATFDWQAIVKACELETEDEKTKSLMEVGSTRKITYADGAVQVVQITEISEKSKRICWQMVTSEPAIGYTSREDSLKLTEVTYPDNNQTVVEWISDFSNDATIQVIVDSDLKKKDAFKDLEAKFGKKS
jgi:hypothetical protein